METVALVYGVTAIVLPFVAAPLAMIGFSRWVERRTSAKGFAKEWLLTAEKPAASNLELFKMKMKMVNR